MILSSLLFVSRAFLYTHPEVTLSQGNTEILNEIISRRIQREPLQYILGFTEFYGFRILVGQGCLVPRPETEILVEHALEKFRGGRFLDWGTGSGCISVALLKEQTSAFCISVDKSPQALSWAWSNMRSHSLLERSLLWHSSGLQDIPVEDRSLDLIVSNPPYIRKEVIPDLMPEVRSFEPWMALDGGPDGLSLYYPFLEWSSRKLKNGASVIVEIGGAEQAHILMNHEFHGLCFEEITKDLSDIPRMLSWRRV